MKKLKKFGALILSLILIACILSTSVISTSAALSIPLLKGGTYTYQINLYSPFRLSEVLARIDYDSSYLQYKSCSSSHLNDNVTLRCDKTMGGLDVLIKSSSASGLDLDPKSCIFQIEFKVLKKTNNNTLPISLTMDTITDTSGFTYFKDGAVNGGILTDISWDTSYNFSIGSTPSVFNLADCAVTLDQTHFVYDGTEKKPNLTVTYGSTTLIPGTDYAWIYENNVDVGVASVHIMALGSRCVGSEVVNFTIGYTDTPLVSIKDCRIVMTEDTFVYNGQPQAPRIVVVYKDDTLLIDGKDYILVYNSDHTDVGTHTVHVTGFFNYYDSVPLEFKIVSAEGEKTSITSCSFSMDSTFYYTGSPITPNVIVTNAGKTLVKGTDYTVSYSNNTNVGTATVKITGIGNYTDTKTLNFTIKKPEVKKVALSDCTITLSKSVYTYDGKAKTPDVTVKYGNTTLAKGTDYTVTYSNNTNAGTGKVTVTGKGNYTGSVSKTFAIQKPQSTGFTWGTDNWNFNNSAPDYFPRTSYRHHISESYLNALKKNLTNTEYYVIFDARGNWLDSQFGGSCYGMSSLTLLAKNGLVPFASYQSGATKLTDLNSPVKNKEVSSLVTYYQMLQVKDQAQQQYRTLPTRSHETNIKEILSTLDKNPLCVIGFKKNGWGGHAILAYGYEYGSWTFGGVNYDGCIKICDPNSSISYNKECNIYFNSKTYNWAIPFYSYAPITSTKGAVINYISADINKINEGGYLSGSTSNKSENFVARIDAESISDNRAVSKVVGANGMYMNQAAGPGEIVEDYSYIVGGEGTGTVGYNLYDANSAYKVVQDVPTELSLSMDYEDCFMTASSMAGNSVLFDNEGYVEVTGDSANFSISMTFDDKYPTSWFTMKVEGTGANSASLQMVDDGYILTSDNLKDISLNAYSKNFSATASLSTTYDSVYIYEINETTIGAKVDKDNNGTYETEIKIENENNLLFGDVNLDSALNVKDATAIQKHIAGLQTLSQQGLSVADYNKDGSINIKDATTIQKKVAGLI